MDFKSRVMLPTLLTAVRSRAALHRNVCGGEQSVTGYQVSTSCCNLYHNVNMSLTSPVFMRFVKEPMRYKERPEPSTAIKRRFMQ